MKRKFLMRSVVCTLLFCIALGVPFAVHAGWRRLYSPWVAFTVEGQTYETRVAIDCSGPGQALFVTTTVATVNNVQVPAGRMFAQSFVMDSRTMRHIAASLQYSNDIPTSGIMVSTNLLHPVRPNSGEFYGLGLAVVRHNGNVRDRRVETPTIWRNNTSALMDNFYNAYNNDGMVEVIGVNDIPGFAFAREIRNATTIGYINVYAGYCLTIVDLFPILPSVVTYLD